MKIFSYFFFSEGERSHLAEAPVWNTGDVGLLQLLLYDFGNKVQGGDFKYSLQEKKKLSKGLFEETTCSDRFFFSQCLHLLA